MFIGIAKGHNGLPVLGIGTKKAIYTLSIPSWFQWQLNKFFGYSDGNVQQGYPESYDALRLQRVRVFPLCFTKGTILPPPEGYKGYVVTQQNMGGYWPVVG